MKFTFLVKNILCSVGLLFLCTAQGISQNTLAPEAWQENLRFLQKTIHKDYAFLFKKVKAEAFDAEIEKFYAAIPSMESHEIKVGLTRMVSFFEYGHTQIPFFTLAEEGVQLEETLTLAKQIAQDPPYKYYDFREELGTAGYNLLSGGNPDGGLFILRLVAESYPESKGAWFNLASAQEQQQQLKKAKENYKKVIDLDPKGMTGRAAKAKLLTLEKQ